MPRYDVIPSAGRVRCYDAGPRAGDRWTILFEDWDDPERGGPVRPYGPRTALGMNSDPTHPQFGVSQFSSGIPRLCGRRVPFAALPERVRLHVLSRLED